MEHDAHAEAPPPQHHVQPAEDAVVDDWAREDAEPMTVDSGAPAEEASEAAPDAAADAPAPPAEGERAPLRSVVISRSVLLFYSLFA